MKSPVSFLLVIIMIISLTSFYLLLSLNSSLPVNTDKIIEIRAQKFEFSPNIIRINFEQEVTLKVVSMDITHGFSIEAFDIDASIDPFTSLNITLKATKLGKFKIKCSVPCGNFHPYMIAELKIVPNILFNLSILFTEIIFLYMIIYNYNQSKGRKFMRLDLIGE